MENICEATFRFVREEWHDLLAKYAQDQEWGTCYSPFLHQICFTNILLQMLLVISV